MPSAPLELVPVEFDRSVVKAALPDTTVSSYVRRRTDSVFGEGIILLWVESAQLKMGISWRGSSDNSSRRE
jgi:hypothetical protein